MLSASVLYVFSLLNPCDICHFKAFGGTFFPGISPFKALPLITPFKVVPPRSIFSNSSCSIALRSVTLTACCIDVSVLATGHVMMGRDHATRLKSSEGTESLQL